MGSSRAVSPTESAPAEISATPDSERKLPRFSLKTLWFILAHIVLIAVLLLPHSESLSWQGQISLAVLGFAVIMWVTEAVSYPVSSVLIIGYITILLGLSPDPKEPSKALGTTDALATALGGFSSSGVALVAAALALAAAMQATELHKRIALIVLRFAGEKTSHIVVGAIAISIILAFFVPSATARAGAVVPILLGMVAAFGMAKDSKLSALLIITAAQSVSTWNIGIKTAVAQNLVAIGFLLLPKIGVFTWKSAEKLINWGTLVVFAVGISLGTLLLKTGAAKWLSEVTFGALGLQHMPLLATIALVSAFTILIHLGFASATSLSSALIPVYIALASTLTAPQDGLGFVVIQQFLISFGFLLPVSAPQNMLAYGTGAFITKQFLKTGIPLTVIGYLLVLLFSTTYWKWLGLV
ncbi:SLC13 family permease [Rothia sp. ND6WE1A]|uniref:anion permease n=1 Tax=Rothia sp. ND6WE1A TaxID=1848190 RepID=UPI0008320374|nr:SLC13 family permease [Rothia sp. ND6WE1A]